MESYKELLIKQARTKQQSMYRILVVIAAVVVSILAFTTFSIIFLTILAVCIVGVYFVFKYTDVEYEYLYLDKEISVDKIVSQSKRKKVGVIELHKVEVIAPSKSHQLDSYRNRTVKVTDYSAGSDLEDCPVYEIYYDGSQKILMNLDEEFIKIISNIIPRKVFIS